MVESIKVNGVLTPVLILPSGDGGEIEENGRHYTVRQGDVYLLMTDRDHEYYSDPEQPWEKNWLNVQGSICETLMEGFRNFLSVCESYAGRLFKAAYRKTPYEYILERKTDTACLLLENTGLSVKEIAYRLNFADEHYFSNVFRKRMGKIPGGY